MSSLKCERQPRDGPASHAFGVSSRPDVGFVACIERGILESQAILLFESIRKYTERFADCSIYAVSPRSGFTIASATRRRLDALEAHYIDLNLNQECREYGSANRVAAAAHIESRFNHEVLVVLDSDTMFLGEPIAFALPEGVDVRVRPVDVKGISTSGSSDPFDEYWLALCRCCRVDYHAIPWTSTTVDRQHVKANYNGGLVVARTERAIMQRWADFFFSSIRAGLRPRVNSPSFRSGVGWITPEVGTFWGSNQAALSLAVWSTTSRVEELPTTYNYPLHLHQQIDPTLASQSFAGLLHVHYHWLFDEDAIGDNPLLSGGGPLTLAQRDWLRTLTPLARQEEG